jgi:hypothetical protein
VAKILDDILPAAVVDMEVAALDHARTRLVDLQ